MRHSVILAGGSGTRLWPASRTSRPKQFLSLGSSESLLAGTARRLGASCEQRLYVVTAADQVNLVRDALPGLPHASVIAEPSARNTAAALGLAAVHLLHADPNAVMAALPADQHIGNEEEFRSVVDKAFEAAEKHDAIITVGIVPTRPETGYGYLRLGAEVQQEHSLGLRQVAAFVEKPDAAKAAEYLRSGDYLWNAGMFFCKAELLLREIATHMPETAKGLQQIADALADGNGDEVCNAIYPTLPSISIDYGVMEQAKSVMTLAGDFEWNDVGSWAALADYCPKDADGNVVVGEATTHQAGGNILVCDPGNVIGVAGVNDLVVVQSGNAILVLPRERAQDVRALVDNLRSNERNEFL